jgi:hypothetical protein
MRVVKLLKRVGLACYNRVLILSDPEKYARSLGVKSGRNVHFYGATP